MYNIFNLFNPFRYSGSSACSEETVQMREKYDENFKLLLDRMTRENGGYEQKNHLALFVILN